ncbi:MAG: helix-turn-helix transcriptional regulator [Bacilli bacterium]|nr:helix-turn-helix transcriptional regulator [Bacilli bacterium]
MNQEKIGRFISERRKIKKMTQAELGEILGVSDKSVSKWETGKCMPDLSLFPELCKVLDITINDLMSGEKVDNEKYINTLEVNIVKLADSLKKKRKNKIKMCIITAIIFLFAIWGYTAYYNLAEETISFDVGMMTCNVYNNELTFSIKGTSILNEHYTIKKVDGKDVYIFNCTLLKKYKDFYAWELKKGINCLDGDIYCKQGTRHNFKLKDDNIDVYYTEYSISKFEKATNDELKNLLEKSNKMDCSNEEE